VNNPVGSATFCFGGHILILKLPKSFMALKIDTPKTIKKITTRIVYKKGFKS